MHRQNASEMIVPDTAAAAGIRPSARVRTIATLMEEDESEIRRMVARGELEAHRKGKRGIRIYLDSVADFQRQRELVPIRPHSANYPNIRASRPINHAAYRAAMASLRKDGIV